MKKDALERLKEQEELDGYARRTINGRPRRYGPTLADVIIEAIEATFSCRWVPKIKNDKDDDKKSSS